MENLVTFRPIGRVRCGETRRKDEGWGKNISDIVLLPELAKGLVGLADFSHVLVVYHLHEARFVPEKDLQRRPQGREDMPYVGIFAQRAKDRPNPIGITAVKIRQVDAEKGTLQVEGLDAVDGTPVLDLKPYYPHYDEKAGAAVPEWVQRLMEFYF